MKRLLTILVLTIVCACESDNPPIGWENQAINNWSQSLFSKNADGIHCTLYWGTKECEANVNGKVYPFICHYDRGHGNCFLRVQNESH